MKIERLKIPHYKHAYIKPTPKNVMVQLMHTHSEIVEAMHACKNKDKADTARELIDVIHSATTGLIMLGYTGNKLHLVNYEIVGKNKQRGYIHDTDDV